MSEAASVLGLSVPTVRSWVAAGVLDAVPGRQPARVTYDSLALAKRGLDGPALFSITCAGISALLAPAASPVTKQLYMRFRDRRTLRVCSAPVPFNLGRRGPGARGREHPYSHEPAKERHVEGGRFPAFMSSDRWN